MDNTLRSATKYLASTLPSIITQACHCTHYKYRGDEIDMWIGVDENASDLEYLGTMVKINHYDTCSIHLTYDKYTCIVKNSNSEIDNVRAVASFINNIRVHNGVQCEDWAEVKATLRL